ncbi:MAG: hypothetical protein IIW51_04845 [Peptococcaceae bacterium]|nr:hypothetical protein [Peptococcaceae bacterium]
MRNKSYISAIIAGLGLLSLISGLIWLKLIPNAAASVFPYLCIGLGCGIFGHGAGELIGQRVTGKHPEIQKQMEIDKNDERNIAISNQAKARAYDAMLYVFGALMISLACMGCNVTIVLLLVAAYLSVVGCFLFYHNRYQKEM